MVDDRGSGLKWLRHAAIMARIAPSPVAPPLVRFALLEDSERQVRGNDCRGVVETLVARGVIAQDPRSVAAAAPRSW